jgi:DNA-binding transcriptional ArsR family regulator
MELTTLCCGASPLNADRLAEVCKALAHPVRVRIVDHLDRLDQCVCGQIVNVIGLAQSTVSQHLKLLKAAGLVKGTIEGPRTCYCLDRQVLAEFKAIVRLLGERNTIHG